jgi:hypothetical protein
VKEECEREFFTKFYLFYLLYLLYLLYLVTRNVFQEDWICSKGMCLKVMCSRVFVQKECVLNVMKRICSRRKCEGNAF